MYIAMNRFKVKNGSQDAFETLWKERETRLPEMDGFVEFHLLRGPVDEEAGNTLYISHTVWADEGAFRAWTQSQSFRDNHRKGGTGPMLTDGHPRFEGFSAVEGA